MFFNKQLKSNEQVTDSLNNFKQNFPDIYGVLSQRNAIDWSAEYDKACKYNEFSICDLFEFLCTESKLEDTNFLESLHTHSWLILLEDLHKKNAIIELILFSKKLYKEIAFRAEDIKTFLDFVKSLSDEHLKRIFLNDCYQYCYQSINYIKDINLNSYLLFGAICTQQPISIIQELILKENGADINSVLGSITFSYFTAPLRLAVTEKSFEIVKCLLEINTTQKIEINCRNESNGATPLLLAVELGLEDIVNLLLEKGANANLELTAMENYHVKFDAYKKDTPLHIAIKLGHEKIVESLLLHGADVHALDLQNRNAMDLAKEVNNTKIIELLDGHDVNANARRRLA